MENSTNVQPVNIDEVPLGQIVKVPDAAARARVSTQRIIELINAGIAGEDRPGRFIRAEKRGREWLIKEVDFNEFLINRPPKVHAGPGRGRKGKMNEK